MKPNFCLADWRSFPAIALFLALVVFAAESVLASSDDAWEEFRQDISTKMERAIAGTFASHELVIEPSGSESYGLAIASGVSAGNKQPLTVFGIYTKKTMKLEIIEVPETMFEKKVASTSDKSSAGTDGKGTAKSTADLLQGKWRDVQDKNNLLVFEGNVRKESSDGGKTWQLTTTFVLGSHCQNPSDAGRPKEITSDDLFISTSDDLCWHIDSVDKRELFLTYIGRGNTLRYVRVTK